ncbi:MAG: tyrosine-type recombinase/integrase [Acidimicrobiia bacterium]|nr:tyrosine-type recombinase/integrase [Acidimicrobiia bacterium]
MSSVDKTEYGTYRVRFRTPDGHSRSKTFKRRVDADAFAATVETSKLFGTYTDPSLGKTRFGEWAPHVQASRINLAPSTRARDDTYFRSFILPYFADESLSKVNPLHVQGWVSALLAKDYAPATIRKAYQLLSAVFDAAVTSDLIARSPCRGIKLPKDSREEMRFLSPDEIEKLADAIDPRYRTLVLTGAYTGLRPGELLGLKVSRLNMLRRQVQVVETLTEVKGQVRLGPPKSKASRRTVTMPAFLVEEFAQHLAQYRDPDDWVFSSPQGGPVRRTNFRRRFWLPAVRASVGEPLRFHDLRHSHAALLIAQGVHPKVLQDRLGHASITTTLDTYGHLMTGLDEAAADALDASRRESPTRNTR